MAATPHYSNNNNPSIKLPKRTDRCMDVAGGAEEGAVAVLMLLLLPVLLLGTAEGVAEELKRLGSWEGVRSEGRVVGTTLGTADEEGGLEGDTEGTRMDGTALSVIVGSAVGLSDGTKLGSA